MDPRSDLLVLTESPLPAYLLYGDSFIGFLYGNSGVDYRAVAAEMPSASEITACEWLTDDELSVYSSEYSRTGFQGGLNWYRCQTDPRYGDDLKVFSDKTIEVPSCFISGSSDWGAFQRPGAIDRMKTVACTDFRDVHMLDGAGHWVQQEQPDQVGEILLKHFR